jgi:hypothetical protein
MVPSGASDPTFDPTSSAGAGRSADPVGNP